MLTLKGRSVSAFVCWMSTRPCVAELAPSPIDPRPPALHTAAARRGVDTPTIGAWMIGYCMSSVVKIVVVIVIAPGMREELRIGSVTQRERCRKQEPDRCCHERRRKSAATVIEC